MKKGKDWFGDVFRKAYRDARKKFFDEKMDKILINAFINSVKNKEVL